MDCRYCTNAMTSGVLPPPPAQRSTTCMPGAAPAMAAMTKLCKQRLEEFGTAGNAGKSRPLPVFEMAKRYKDGSLDPKIG